MKKLLILLLLFSSFLFCSCSPYHPKPIYDEECTLYSKRIQLTHNNNGNELSLYISKGYDVPYLSYIRRNKLEKPKFEDLEVFYKEGYSMKCVLKENEIILPHYFILIDGVGKCDGDKTYKDYYEELLLSMEESDARKAVCQKAYENDYSIDLVKNGIKFYRGNCKVVGTYYYDTSAITPTSFGHIIAPTINDYAILKTIYCSETLYDKLYQSI